MNFSVLDFFKFASRMPQIVQLLGGGGGGYAPGPSSKFPPFFFFFFFFALAIPGSVLTSWRHGEHTQTHSSDEIAEFEIAEFSFENAAVKSISYCKQWVKSKLSLSSECVKMKLCKPCTSFTSHLHSSCGMMWFRTLTLREISPKKELWIQNV